MANIETNRVYYSSIIAGRVTAVMSDLIGALVSWNDARITRKSLSRLSLRELDDIGLTPGDIDTIATRNARF